MAKASLRLTPAASGDDIAAIVYTSGSTGQPKGVMHSHANIVAAGFAVAAGYQLDEETVSLISGPLFHVGATGLAIPTLMAAGSLSILPRFDAARALERVEQHRVTVLNGVPTMLRMMLEHPDCRGRDLIQLLNVPFGGAPMPPSLLKELLDGDAAGALPAQLRHDRNGIELHDAAG